MLRFLVAMGTGGEWAVGGGTGRRDVSRPCPGQAASIFQASSTLGTWMAGIVAMAIGSQWRYGYLVGVLPAVLILWVRARARRARRLEAVGLGACKKKGSLVDLFGDARWRGRAIGGMLLAAVGLATFWGVTVAGQDLAECVGPARRRRVSTPPSSTGKFAYTIVQATGGGIGLLAFGPFCQWIGRKRAFVLVQLLGDG